MGLLDSNSAVFLSIGDGKIVRRVKEPTTRSRQRTTKTGKVVEEETYDAIEGYITEIKVYDHQDFGKFWNVYLKDDTGDQYCLQMNYSSGYSTAFLKMLPNVDFRLKVKISPTMKIVDNKKKVGLFLNQDGLALKHFFTKDNPNGLPQMKEVVFKGVKQWDDTDMMNFFLNMVEKDIKPNIQRATAERNGSQPGSATSTPADVAYANDADDSDIPF